MARHAATVVDDDGRRKAYRPLVAAARLRALDAGLAAYEVGDFFLAHELLEPAWMGTRDPVERDLHQGLIKLAAAGVHATRGNAAGVRKNLAGALRRLGQVVATGPAAADAGTLEAASPAGAPVSRPAPRARATALGRVDVPGILDWVAAALAELELADTLPAAPTAGSAAAPSGAARPEGPDPPPVVSRVAAEPAPFRPRGGAAPSRRATRRRDPGRAHGSAQR